MRVLNLFREFSRFWKYFCECTSFSRLCICSRCFLRMNMCYCLLLVFSNDFYTVTCLFQCFCTFSEILLVFVTDPRFFCALEPHFCVFGILFCECACLSAFMYQLHMLSANANIFITAPRELCEVYNVTRLSARMQVLGDYFTDPKEIFLVFVLLECESGHIVMTKKPSLII